MLYFKCFIEPHSREETEQKKSRYYLRETWQNLSKGKSIFGMFSDGLVSVNEVGFSLIGRRWTGVPPTLGVSLIFCFGDDFNNGHE